MAYSYDAGGRCLSLSLDGQLFTTYGYDDASRLVTITRGTGVFGFGYDNANRRTSMTYPNGVATAYTYDDLDRLLRLKADHGQTPITDFQYVYDAAGNRTRKQQLDYTEDYTYDVLDRLTGASRTGAGAAEWRWGYDAVGNRLTNQKDLAVTTSTYNERNELLTSGAGGPLRVRGVLDEPGTAKVNGQPARMLASNTFEATIDATVGTNAFTVEATDESGNVRAKSWQVDVTGTGASYSYDPNGNLTQKVDGADTWVYEWNAENQLIRVTRNSLEIARYAYDPQGRRLERVAGGVTTSWAYSAEDILVEATGGTTLKFVHGSGIDDPFAAQSQSQGTSYLHVDGLGSVIRVTNQSGVPGVDTRYDAWGRIEAGDVGRYGFTGREPEPETGLHYYRERHYDPVDGRFISEDLVASEFTHRYSYVGDRPTVGVDPMGLFSAVYPVGDCIASMARGAMVYRQMKTGQPPPPMDDSTAHCLVHCYFTRGCTWWSGANSFTVGMAFEYAQQCYYQGLGVIRGKACKYPPSPADICSNATGQLCPPWKSCGQCCAKAKCGDDPAQSCR